MKKTWKAGLGVFALAVSVTAGMVGAANAAEGFPVRPITLLVPYSAGGPTDIMARQLAEGLTRELGQSVLVENRTGAGGLVALHALARAPGDGYTLGVMVTPITAIAPLTQANFEYDVVKSFTPITDVVNYSLVLMVGEHVKAKAVGELVEHARQNPSAVSYGSSGVGGTNHLAGALLSYATGTPMLHVPYKGNAPAANDVMGGRLSFIFDMPNSAVTYTQSGKLRPLAITASKRNPVFPDLPTMAESGFPDVTVEGWYGIMAPPDLPADVLARLDAAIKTVKESPAFSSKMQEAGFEVTPTKTPQAFGERIAKERDFWKNLIKTADIPLQ